MVRKVEPDSLSDRFGNNPEFIDSCTRDQSRAIYEFLTERGLPVEMDPQGFMIIRERHAGRIREALQLVFDNRIKGWWNLRREMIARKVCSKEEFEKARDALTSSDPQKVA